MSQIETLCSRIQSSTSSARRCGAHPQRVRPAGQLGEVRIRRELDPGASEIVERKETWNRTARYCPGIGKGPLIQIGTAMETAEEQRLAYPEMYK